MIRKVLSLTAACAVMLGAACSIAGCGGFDSAEYNALTEIRFASFYGTETENACKLKMRVPATDEYSVSFKGSDLEKVTLFSEEGEELVSSETPFEISLKAGELVFAELVPVNNQVKLEIAGKDALARLPFALPTAPAAATVSGGGDVAPANLTYTKRAGGLYVYSNTPEEIPKEAVNSVLTRQDVSNREVFFTFEHGSSSVKSGFYYGYRVKNTGTEDLYLTVKNVGMQLAGAGSYYGQKEWIDFYNTVFQMPDMTDWTKSQQSNFKAFFNMGNTEDFIVPDFRPTTYRIPAGEYMYAIGGTKKDAYNGYCVGKTEDAFVTGNCQNGAVLFDVVGSAEGAFLIYDDIAKLDENTHYGANPDYGRCYNGTDEGIVVDGSASWAFNDSTAPQLLPVTYTNSYLDEVSSTGTPFEKIASTSHMQTGTEWMTHANPQGYHTAVGTDMTEFHTVDTSGNPVAIGTDCYDSTGRLSNLGNWMKDYIDAYTFTNEGDRDRQVTLKLYAQNGGALVVMARDESGAILEGSAKNTLYYGDSDYGEKIDEPYLYTVTVKAHSTLKIFLEYNLMANSYGSVYHSVELV